MTSSEYDAAIGKAISEQAELKTRMEAAAEELRSAVSLSLSPIYEHRMQYALQERAESVASKGVEALRKVKADFETLHKSIPDVVKRHFGGDHIWPHRQQPENLPAEDWGHYSISHGDRNLCKEFDAPFRRCLGEIGSLLQKHDLTTEHSVREYENLGSGMRYAIGYECPKEVVEAARRYCDLYREFRSSAKKIRELEHGKAGLQAKSLWDSIE